MTIRFFALFFMQQCGVSPMGVSLLGALSPLLLSVASVLAQRASRHVGRVQTRRALSETRPRTSAPPTHFAHIPSAPRRSLCTRLVDIALLVSMAYIPVTALNTLLGVHLLRFAAANCTRPLMRSGACVVRGRTAHRCGAQPPCWPPTPETFSVDGPRGTPPPRPNQQHRVCAHVQLERERGGGCAPTPPPCCVWPAALCAAASGSLRSTPRLCFCACRRRVGRPAGVSGHLSGHSSAQGGQLSPPAAAVALRP